MRALSAGLACLLLVVLLTGCAKAPEEAYKTRFLALGTLVDVSIRGASDEQAAEAVRAIETALDEIHHLWHAWEPGELARINAALAAGEAVTVDADTGAVLRQAAQLASDSGHLFNPAIGRLVALWGFHGETDAERAPPDAEAIAALVDAAPTMDALTMETTESDALLIRSDNPAVQIDLGAFAKGVGIDRAIAAVRDLGIDHAIVNAGGDLRAIGTHGERPWRIGIRHPVERGIIASVETRGDEAVFTSGNYERFFEHDGRRYHHILDPRSGAPAGDTISVTVIHDNAAEADAAVTALFVAGPEQWRAVAERLGITQVMLIDADMDVHMTPAMEQRIRFEGDRE